MEVKKSIEADVSNARVPFGINGVLFIAGITLASFSFTTPIIEEAEKEQVEQKKDKDVEEADEKKADVPPPPPAAAAAAPTATIDMAQAIDENTVEIDNTGEVKTDISTGTQSTAATGETTNAIDNVDVAVVTEEVVDVPDVEASFPGGSPSAWFAKNIIYPEIAQENGDEGTVLVTFVVEKDGRLTSVAIPKGRGQTPELDAEAIKKVRMMPNWTPGQNNGNACRSKFQVKVVFKLG